MNFFGKLLVLVHGAASIGVLTWAVGVYTQRINWSSTDKDDPGLFVRQKTKGEDYAKAAGQALNRWNGNLSSVNALENERFPRRGFYAGQLAMLQTGTLDGRPVPNPVQELLPAANGYLDVTRLIGRKAIEAGKGVPLDSVKGYDDKAKKLVAELIASQTTNAEEIVKRDAVNREIVGVKDPKVVKGLRQLINEQLQIKDAADDEDTYVSNFVTNREAEFGLLKKRRDAMTARMGELKDLKKEKPESGK